MFVFALNSSPVPYSAKNLPMVDTDFKGIPMRKFVDNFYCNLHIFHLSSVKQEKKKGMKAAIFFLDEFYKQRYIAQPLANLHAKENVRFQRTSVDYCHLAVLNYIPEACSCAY